MSDASASVPWARIRPEAIPLGRTYGIDFGDGNEFTVVMNGDGRVEHFCGGYNGAENSTGDGFFIDGDQFAFLLAWLNNVAQLGAVMP